MVFSKKMMQKRIKTIRFANVHFFVLTIYAQHPIKFWFFVGRKKVGLCPT